MPNLIYLLCNLLVNTCNGKYVSICRLKKRIYSFIFLDNDKHNTQLNEYTMEFQQRFTQAAKRHLPTRKKQKVIKAHAKKIRIHDNVLPKESKEGDKDLSIFRGYTEKQVRDDNSMSNIGYEDGDFNIDEALLDNLNPRIFGYDLDLARKTKGFGKGYSDYSVAEFNERQVQDENGENIHVTLCNEKEKDQHRKFVKTCVQNTKNISQSIVEGKQMKRNIYKKRLKLASGKYSDNDDNNDSDHDSDINSDDDCDMKSKKKDDSNDIITNTKQNNNNGSESKDEQVQTYFNEEKEVTNINTNITDDSHESYEDNNESEEQSSTYSDAENHIILNKLKNTQHFRDLNVPILDYDNVSDVSNISEHNSLASKKCDVSERRLLLENKSKYNKTHKDSHNSKNIDRNLNIINNEEQECGKRPSTEVNSPRSQVKGKDIFGHSLYIEEPIEKKAKHKKACIEMRALQMSGELLSSKSAFQRLCREIVYVDLEKEDVRFQVSAIAALQESTEAYITDIMQKVNVIAHHCKRSTIMKKDLHIVFELFQNERKCYWGNSSGPRPPPTQRGPLPMKKESVPRRVVRKSRY